MDTRQCIITETTGTNHIDTEACKRRGITVFYTPGASIEAVSEHALAMVDQLDPSRLRIRY